MGWGLIYIIKTKNVNYVTVCREGRAEHTARLVQHVKLAKLSPASVSCLLQSSLITAEAATTATTHQPEAAADTGSRSRGLNKFIVAMAFDSSAVEYLDLDRVEEGWQLLTECPNMRYGLSGAGLVSMGDTLLVTGGVGRQGILKAINRWTHNLVIFTIFNIHHIHHLTIQPHPQVHHLQREDQRVERGTAYARGQVRLYEV